ncbi:MAG: HD domain-containing protein [Spirochaetaceae bacterium]|jgi:HD superfamily phosphohydrolase|nr:HD domain-containing protein [Spirochaetaceae bacterium]
MNDVYTNKILGLMLDYNGNDVRRINHTLKVFALARNIAQCENCDKHTLAIIEYAAILHDIGLHKAEELYSSGMVRYHEDLGSKVAKELIDDLEIDSDIKDRVYFLIGNHHSYKKIDGMDFQILVEADLIVNMYEDEYGRDTIARVKQKIFKTETGKSLLDSMYLNDSPL